MKILNNVGLKLQPCFTPTFDGKSDDKPFGKNYAHRTESAEYMLFIIFYKFCADVVICHFIK